METPKLEWMYRNSNETVDHEEYLLGRPVDKAFESTLGNEIEKDCLPTPIFSNTNSSIQVDVIRKLKEDPLEIIRQQEIERRKQLLKNPVKLKKLQNMLKAKQEEEDGGSAKKKKKKKKKSVSSVDEDDQDLDSLLASKYLKLMKKHGIKSFSDLSSLKVKKQRNKKKNSDSSSEDSDESSESDDERPIKRKKKRNYSSGSSESERDTKNDASHKSSSSKTEGKSMKNRSRDEYEPKSSEKCTSKQRKEKDEKGNHKYKNKEPDTSESDSQSDSRNKNKYGLVRMGKNFDKDHRKSRNRRSRSSSIEHKQTTHKDNKPKDSGGVRKYDSSIKRNYNKPKSNHLSEEEKQKKLQEMMENAKWRDEVRVKNVTRYRKEEAEEKNKSGKEYNDNFYRKQMAIAASSGTVESRIKSNINNIQRSKFSMDQNFARR